MKTLIFDCGGVLAFPRLGDWNLPVRAAALLGAHAADLHTAKYLLAHRAASAWLDESKLVPDVETERELRRGYFSEMNQRMGWQLDAGTVGALGDDFTFNLDRYVFFDGVYDWLARWKADYRLALLSDAMPSMLEALKRQRIDGLFDAMVISTHIGAIKPDRRMYAAILQALGTQPEDCLFIDDKIENVEGALAVGMRAAQMAHPSFPPAAIWTGGAVVRGFADLDRQLSDGGLWKQAQL